MTIEASYVSWAGNEADTFAHLKPDLALPKYVTLEVREEAAYDLDLNVALDLELGRYVVHSMQVRRRASGGEVNAVGLRALTVQTYLRTGLDGLAWIGDREGEKMPFPIGPDLAAEIRSRGPSDEGALRWAARIYKLAEVLNQRPALAVRDQLSLSAPQATTWILRARELGLVEDWPPDMEDAARTFENAKDRWDG